MLQPPSPLLLPSSSPMNRSIPKSGSLHLLRRVFSRDAVAPMREHVSSATTGDDEAPVVPSPQRQPLAMLVPPALDSPRSFGSEASDDDLPSRSLKRQRLGSTCRLFSPLARNLPPRPSPGFRPPPIRTMLSLEGPELWGDAAVVPTPLVQDAPTPPPLPTPRVRPGSAGSHFGSVFGVGMGMGGYRGGSRLGVPHMSLVAPNLFVGDESSAQPPARLVEQGVTHVLNCTNKPNAALESPGGVTGAGLVYLRLDLLDSTSDLPRMQSVLRQGVDFIRSGLQSGGTVLVHCQRGISRSCTLAMAYLIEAQQRPAEAVFESIRGARRICDPNLSYWCALHEWERAVLHLHLKRPRSSSGGPLASPRPLSRAG